MLVQVNLYDLEEQVRRSIREAVNKEIDSTIKMVLETTDIHKLITERVNYHVDKSKYTSDSIIRNLVQQKIARELKDKINGSI